MPAPRLIALLARGSLAVCIGLTVGALPAFALQAPDKAPQLVEVKPTWAELSGPEQAALSPLKAEWPGMTVGHKRKWQELARDFGKKTPQEQTRLQERMREWARLSPQERNSARLNFNDAAQALSKDQWEAYQALPESEKQALANQNKPPKSAALGFKPTERDRLAEVPAPPSPAASGKARPRIEVRQER
jgi:hypothetical protein